MRDKDWMHVKFFYIPFPIALALSVGAVIALILFG
jgi:hypothetical protein